MTDVGALVKRAEIKSGMLRMGEPITFGSDADVIDDLVAALAASEAARIKAEGEVERLRSVLEDIAESDDVDNALDPARNKRLARAALRREP